MDTIEILDLLRTSSLVIRAKYMYKILSKR